MDKALVSIIVPVYNVQNYVHKCLESLAQQTYSNLEIIIVDDGSTDGSGEICDEFVRTKKRARVYHKKNGGLSDARNYGIKKSKGSMLALVDSDDYVERDFIKVMVEALESNNADITVCGFNKKSPKNEVMTGEEATRKLLIEQENMDIVAWNKLYKRKLFVEENIWYPVGMKHEDALTTYKLLAKAKKVVYVHQSLYNYVKRDDSIMAEVKNVDRLKMRERAAKEAVDYFSSNGELQDAARVSLLLAKYAYMDDAIKGKIDQEYYVTNCKWVKMKMGSFKDNNYLTSKLKLYNFLVLTGLYKVFRKVV